MKNRQMKIKQISMDVIVIGGGAAGVRAALAAHQSSAKVMLVCKGIIGKSGSTPLASWGFAAALGASDPRDTPHQHMLDTLANGRDLADPKLAEVLADHAIECLEDLIECGVHLVQSAGKPEQLQMPGETYPRSVLVQGGGQQIIRLLKQKLNQQGIGHIEDFLVTRLLIQNNKVMGVMGISLREGVFMVIHAKSVVLAGGGYGSLWESNDNPPHNSGDMFYLAYQAGARLIDLEMAQYYPTVVIYPQSAKGVLVDYEVCLAPHLCDGRLLNHLGQPIFAIDEFPARDKLIKRIFEEISKGHGSKHGGVYLDFSQSRQDKAKIRQCLKQFVGGYEFLQTLGVDLLETPIELAPMVHYTLGGIEIDHLGQTSIAGLFACGEAAGNIHGANRISGNALAETQVFGKLAGRAAAAFALNAISTTFDQDLIYYHYNEVLDLLSNEKEIKIKPELIRKRIQEIMDRYVGFGRDAASLKQALTELRLIKKDQLPYISVEPLDIMNLQLVTALEVKSMMMVSEMVCRAAQIRKESRGHHLRGDYPDQSQLLNQRHTFIQKVNRRMKAGIGMTINQDQHGAVVKNIQADIFRFNPNQDSEGYWQRFNIPADESKTIQSLLRYIQRELDPSLAYRDYNCFQGSCAACTVEVNGFNCRSCCSIATVGETVAIRPAKGKLVIKDLLTS